MCIIFWFQSETHPQYKFVLAFNRDEDLARPYRPVHFWDANPNILAGLDLPSAGTWMGVNVTTGNVAFLTNCDYLPWKQVAGIEFSRGGLIRNFLSLPKPVIKAEECEAIMGNIAKHGKEYNGFNLVYTNVNSNCSYYINNFWDQDKVVRLAGEEPQSLTNGILHNDLYKATAHRGVLGEILCQPDCSLDATKDRIFQLMRCCKKAPADKLPSTSSPDDLALERTCSSIFVSPHTKEDRTCGTVWSGLLVVTRNDELHFYERIYDHTKKQEFVGPVHPLFEKYGIGAHDIAPVAFEEHHVSRKLGTATAD